MQRWIRNVPLKNLLEELEQNYVDKMSFVRETNRTEVKEWLQYAIEQDDPLYLVLIYTGSAEFASHLAIDLAKIGSNLRSVEITSDHSDNKLLKDIGPFICTSLLFNYPIFKPFQYASTTFRGMLLSTEDFKAYEVGKILMTLSILSTSKSREVAELYLPFSDSNNGLPTICTYKISDPRSSLAIETYSQFSEEKEVLIVPFVVFEITTIRDFIGKREGKDYLTKEIELVECDRRLQTDIS